MSSKESRLAVAPVGTGTKTTVHDSRVETPPATPTALSRSVHDLFAEIRTIQQKLSNLSNLAPAKQVNRLLTRLVELCIAPYDATFTNYFFSINGADAMCIELRALCAVAEGELENYWTDRILSASADAYTPRQAQDVLQQFPYHENYMDLSRLEASLLTTFLPSSRTTCVPTYIAFIGSGPLPLSSIHLLAYFPSAKIHNIDRDANALQQSQALIQRLGYASCMTFSCEDATSEVEASNWERFDVVFLAALVGMTSAEKMRILGNLVRKLKGGCLVVCRSAKGMREVLYPILELSDELAAMGYEILAELHPWTSVVNSVVLLRVR